MNEARAIQLCLKHRDPRGFEYLFKTYRKQAYYHAFSLLTNREDATDACQESFARAYHAMPGLESLDAFYPWFYRILRNCCLNMISRRQTIVKHAPALHYDAAAKRTDVPLPDTLMVKREGAEAVWHALETLKPGFREILIMKYWEDASYDQISERLSIPRGTVMSRLYYARKAFSDAYRSQDTSG